MSEIRVSKTKFAQIEITHSLELNLRSFLRASNKDPDWPSLGLIAWDSTFTPDGDLLLVTPSVLILMISPSVSLVPV